MDIELAAVLKSIDAGLKQMNESLAELAKRKPVVVLHVPDDVSETAARRTQSSYERAIGTPVAVVRGDGIRVSVDGRGGPAEDEIAEALQAIAGSLKELVVVGQFE